MDLVQEAIIGTPVTVTLGGEEYRLAYPISAVILYMQKTAELAAAKLSPQELEKGRPRGDNLFRSESWQKIAPVEDPERFLACLWAGLQAYHPQLTLEKLSGLVDFRNAAELNTGIARAIASYFPKKKEGADPNVATPEPDEQVLAETTNG